MNEILIAALALILAYIAGWRWGGWVAYQSDWSLRKKLILGGIYGALIGLVIGLSVKLVFAA